MSSTFCVFCKTKVGKGQCLGCQRHKLRVEVMDYQDFLMTVASTRIPGSHECPATTILLNAIAGATALLEKYRHG